MRILNLYSCLGGNRYLWNDPAFEITAVEIDPVLAEMYKQRFPNDRVIVGDAHKFLLENYQDYDFIWSSPPCPSHSKARFWGSKGGQCSAVYPDMKLYEEIILLKHYFNGLFCVENVNPFYDLLIPGYKRGRHIYWTNFNIPAILSHRVDPASKREANELTQLCDFHKIDLSNYKGDIKKIKLARNLVDYVAGNTILNAALGIKNNVLNNQIEIFN